MDCKHEPGQRQAGPVARLALLAGLAVAAPGLSAQPAEIENAPPQPVPGRVLSDAQPLPAEDRESTGAVVLHDSRVRAQRESFRAADRRTGMISAIGHNVTRVLERARGWGEASEADAGAAGEPAEPPAPSAQ